MSGSIEIMASWIGILCHHGICDAEKLHDPFIQVQIFQTLKQVFVLAIKKERTIFVAGGIAIAHPSDAFGENRQEKSMGKSIINRKSSHSSNACVLFISSQRTMLQKVGDSV
ncbi:hypothetical protein NQ318_017345 [Aromia moschata]|uniref:Uncharacterized protein n=1 Tax=Aromia moschata TaxID=1265417 RepID=A0AAV8X9J1_9CUCU|nr:hypothetical protein NQ318_017345 [Aromia moschata]